MKFVHNWKTHYLQHVSEDERPHKCNVCNKGFITAPQLKKHMKTHETKMKKEEPNFHQTQYHHQQQQQHNFQGNPSFGGFKQEF